MFNGYMIKNKGQVLLFVIVTMTIAMSVGIAIATRTLASLSRVSREDTSNKATAAAEAGIESILSLSNSVLANLTSGPTGIGTSSYTLTEPVSRVDTRVAIRVERFSSNVTGNVYQFTLDPGFVKEISLTRYGTAAPGKDLRVCWDNPRTAVSYVIYSSTVASMGFILPSDGGSTIGGSNFSQGTANVASANATFAAGCKTFKIFSNTTGIRLRSLYESASISVGDGTNVLPSQGYKITSSGSLFKEGKLTTAKKITVFKSKPYMPSIFDAALYTERDLVN